MQDFRQKLCVARNKGHGLLPSCSRDAYAYPRSRGRDEELRVRAPRDSTLLRNSSDTSQGPAGCAHSRPISRGGSISLNSRSYSIALWLELVPAPTRRSNDLEHQFRQRPWKQVCLWTNRRSIIKHSLQVIRSDGRFQNMPCTSAQPLAAMTDGP